MTITIEPGVYVEGWGGIRIEDTVLVTAGGCEILTPTPKTLREIAGWLKGTKNRLLACGSESTPHLDPRRTLCQTVVR